MNYDELRQKTNRQKGRKIKMQKAINKTQKTSFNELLLRSKKGEMGKGLGSIIKIF